MDSKYLEQIIKLFKTGYIRNNNMSEMIDFIKEIQKKYNISKHDTWMIARHIEMLEQQIDFLSAQNLEYERTKPPPPFGESPMMGGRLL